MRQRLPIAPRHRSGGAGRVWPLSFERYGFRLRWRHTLSGHGLSKWSGGVPIAPTPFTESGELDLEGQRRVLDCVVDQGVDGICVLANYSEQFVLTDAERDILVELCLSHVADRVPVIVTCSHFSTRIATERARKAHTAGAKMVMLMPPYHGTALRADESRMFEHFARVAEAVPIPIMIQDAPLSGVNLSVLFLARLAQEIPQI